LQVVQWVAGGSGWSVRRLRACGIGARAMPGMEPEEVDALVAANVSAARARRRLRQEDLADELVTVTALDLLSAQKVQTHAASATKYQLA
jgi:hypothetical protein